MTTLSGTATTRMLPIYVKWLPFAAMARAMDEEYPASKRKF
jgi:hypothetical protein